MRLFPDRDSGTQITPPVIPQFEMDFDRSGMIATAQPNGATRTATNPFFQDLGNNGRTCFTCHQPQTGWSTSAAGIQARFYASYGTDPIFRLVDGATCPTNDVSTPAAKQQAYTLLLSKGLFRIGLPVPANAQYKIISVDDPYGCNTDPETGLAQDGTGIVSVYRRSLPATNLGFLGAVMWDAREPSLSSQATDATLTHAQGNKPPTSAQVQQIVAFEQGLFTAQVFDGKAHALNSDGATGGPDALSKQASSFYVGINDSSGANPRSIPFDPKIFDIFDAWADARGLGTVAASRKAIAHGQQLFNTTPIKISANSSGFCGTCHDTPDVGGRSVATLSNIGVAKTGDDSPPGLDISGLPVFTVQCNSGPSAGQIYNVTDLGRALITGHCSDIGKFKPPILRGLAARAPYFHNGSAATLLDVVNFYDQHFNIGFTDQDKQDLAAFLATL